MRCNKKRKLKHMHVKANGVLRKCFKCRSGMLRKRGYGFYDCDRCGITCWVNPYNYEIQEVKKNT